MCTTTGFLRQSPRNGTAKSMGMNTFKGFNITVFPSRKDVIIYTSISSMHFPVHLPTFDFFFLNLDKLIGQKASINISVNTDGAKIFSHG